jgi:hypothetical protein
MNPIPPADGETRYAEFDRARLKIEPLENRANDLDLSVIMSEDGPFEEFENPVFGQISGAISRAVSEGKSVILMMGAHVLRAGNSRLIIRAMEQGWISHIAINGAGIIHDYEFARLGATTESVARYIRTGQFGLWRETGELNDIIVRGAERNQGLGEAVGEAIETSDFPNKEISILAAGYRLGIPVTVHVGIGYDIIHEHPNCSGAAVGATSYKDFLRFAAAVENLEGGVFLNFGTAVMGPEVYLKALSMARNVARQEGRQICNFSTAVFDLVDLPDSFHEEAPRGTAGYYFRPWKTILVRTVADGGTSYYVQGEHRVTFPALYQAMQPA